MGFKILLGLVWFVACIASLQTSAREIFVSKLGDDGAAGDQQHPYLTIGKAAEVAQPGDLVIVQGGTYREWVKPVRGGTSAESRITFRAAPGEKVSVKGSERVDSWTRVQGGVWKVVLSNAYFGDYNPYALQVSGGWLNYGQWHHRGDVYLNGQAFLEKQKRDEVQGTKHSWCCEVSAKSTTLWANFGTADPNSEVAEINVRESLFMPQVTGLNYITVDGFHFLHGAANWAPPVIPLQTGAVGTRMGKGWIIENCVVSDIRCVGIILGQAPGADYENIDSYGDHIVRNNIIRRCGQAGIAGQKGATRCLIAGNLIEETNYRKEFGGWETAAIKFHNSVDTVIEGNLIRGVYHQKEGAFGIWIDFGNQGTRISRNLIYNTQTAALFLEMNHGPTLVDNNIFVGGGFRSNSQNTVFAHNLLADFRVDYVSDTKRRAQYFAPHTTKVIGKKTGVPANEKWFSNIFVGTGLGHVKLAPGFSSDRNAYLQGAAKSQFGDQASVVESRSARLAIEDRPLGAVIRFDVSQQVVDLETRAITAERFGPFPTVKQALEDRHGRPIRVAVDWRGERRELVPTGAAVGPLSNLKTGENRVQWAIQKR